VSQDDTNTFSKRQKRPPFTWLVPLVAPVDIRTSGYTKAGHQVGAMSTTARRRNRSYFPRIINHLMPRSTVSVGTKLVTRILLLLGLRVRIHPIRHELIVYTRCYLMGKFRVWSPVKCKARPCCVFEPDDFGGMWCSIPDTD